MLKRLSDEALESLLQKAEGFEGRALPVDADARGALMAMADGDGRYLLTLAETLFNIGSAEPMDIKTLSQVLQKRSPAYDKDPEEHYNLISALHKSIRGSTRTRPCTGWRGCWRAARTRCSSPRRCAASEDIGSADPVALLVANAAKDTYDFLGSPEGELALAQACGTGSAPKSNVYKAFGEARRAARETGRPALPTILNAPTKLMKGLHGAGYAYDHDAEIVRPGTTPPITPGATPVLPPRGARAPKRG